METVALSTIKSWQDTREEVNSSDFKLSAPPSTSQPSKFPFNKELNNKIKVYKGELYRLEIEAIVNATNETISETQGMSGAICELAGPDLQAEIDKLEGCRTGEAKFTHGFNLPAKYIIFTVGPRYNPKYQTAAENALHSCYRSCLQVMKEIQCSTLALPPIHSESRGYPPENGAHIAIRTLRRFLEKYGDSIQTVVFSLDRMADYDLYQQILPLYFPRSEREEQKAVNLLPADVGDENGETIIEERKIRIGAFPGLPYDGTENAEDDRALRQFNKPVLSHTDEESDSSPSMLSFMQADPDEAKKKVLASKPDKEREKERMEYNYQKYLRQGRKEDLSDIAQLNFLYQSGVDSFDRPIVVIVAMHLPATIDLERVMMFIIRTMDPIATKKDYIVVYLHTNMTEETIPEFSWLRRVHEFFDLKYSKNLAACYVVHPTFWLKVMAVILSPFLSPNITGKLRYFEGLSELIDVVDLRVLNIPNAVFQYDAKEHGSHLWKENRAAMEQVHETL